MIEQMEIDRTLLQQLDYKHYFSRTNSTELKLDYATKQISRNIKELVSHSTTFSDCNVIKKLNKSQTFGKLEISKYKSEKNS